jgi:hypothetical protein
MPSAVLNVLRFGPIRLDELTSRVSEGPEGVASEINMLSQDNVVTVEKDGDGPVTPEEAGTMPYLVKLTSKGLSHFLR